ncbi:methylisocitrate lyase [Endozoicomonas sp. Mp262]|uniref:methylisocitrate lyase n=1 Tax=Endozoicomonas sp. Mp262 TaxID=2919499 RepID=UPI0021DB1D1E
MPLTPGTRFRKAVSNNKPLQIVGTINAYCAILAERQGHQAIYLSGAGVANASYGLPDLGVTNLNDVLTDVARITSITQLPLLVDVDTGWGGVFNITRTIKEMIRAGAAAIHIEDQVAQKRCGHRPNKAIVDKFEMADRIKAAVDARTDDTFVIMARTDALAAEGIEAAIERAQLCIDAGADMIFPEAVRSLDEYQQFSQALRVPVLANITEFSNQTPLFECHELADAGVDMVLYPLTAFRAMSKAAEQIYHTLAKEGHQKTVLKHMQTREELYECLNYYTYEQKIDELYEK